MESKKLTPPACHQVGADDRKLRQDAQSELAARSRVTQDLEIQHSPHLGVVLECPDNGPAHGWRIDVPESVPSVEMHAQAEDVNADHNTLNVRALVESRPGFRRVRVEAPHLARHVVSIRAVALISQAHNGGCMTAHSVLTQRRNVPGQVRRGYRAVSR